MEEKWIGCIDFDNDRYCSNSFMVAVGSVITAMEMNTELYTAS